MKEYDRPQYITQINAFHRFTETTHLPLNARMLWFSLIDLFNRADWAKWISVDTLHLMAMIDAKSDKTAFLARQKLVDAGLLVYESGKKGEPCRYRLLWFTKQSSGESSGKYSVESYVESSVENSVENSVESSVENSVENSGYSPENPADRHTLYTRKEEDKDTDKDKTKEILPSVPAELEDAFRAFADMREKMGKPLTNAAAGLLLRKLSTLAPGRYGVQRQILEQSVVNGWSGVFPLKHEEAPEPPASYDVEEFERRLLYGKVEYKKRE